MQAAPQIALIFRLQMFKASEPFITAQAGALRSFAPVYLGRHRFGPPPQAAHYALEDGAGKQSGQIIWNAVTRRPGAFLKSLGTAKPSLIHAHFGPDGIYALPLARRLSIPLVTTFHGFDATVSAGAMLRSGSPYLANYLLFRGQLAQHGAMFLAVSKHIQNKIIKLGFPVERTRLHYIGVDTASIQPPPSRRINQTILHVARLVDKKGSAYLIRAFARIAVRHPKAELIIIGDGSLRQKLQSLAQTSGVGASVKFLGVQPNDIVLEYMQDAAVFVLPSVTADSGDTEGLPITILEASASGLPIIGTYHGGIPEAVHDGITGLLVPERDVEALAAALDNLLSDRAARLRMGEAARALIVKDFNLQAQTERLEQFYSGLLR